MNWIDVLFLITLVVLVLNGLRNGFVLSLINLISIPLGFVAIVIIGPRFINWLADIGITITPIVSYVILFFGVVFIVHLIGSTLRGGVRATPVVGQGDALLGGALGIVEAWLVWLLLLMALGWFLGSTQEAVAAGEVLNIDLSLVHQWQEFYNQAVTTSLFAQVNSVFVSIIPAIKVLEPVG